MGRDSRFKQFVKKRSLTAHYGTPSDYIRGLIREDLQRLEQERLEIELMKGLQGKGIPMTPEAWKRMRAEAAKIAAQVPNVAQVVNEVQVKDQKATTN